VSCDRVVWGPGSDATTPSEPSAAPQQHWRCLRRKQLPAVGAAQCVAPSSPWRCPGEAGDTLWGRGQPAAVRRGCQWAARGAPALAERCASLRGTSSAPRACHGSTQAGQGPGRAPAATAAQPAVPPGGTPRRLRECQNSSTVLACSALQYMRGALWHHPLTAAPACSGCSAGRGAVTHPRTAKRVCVEILPIFSSFTGCRLLAQHASALARFKPR